MGQTLKLSEARELAPAPKGIIGEWAHELREAAYDAIRPSDVKEIMQKQVEKAREGDAAAAKFVTGFLIGAGPKNVTVINQKHVHMRRRKKVRADEELKQRIALVNNPENNPLFVPSPHAPGTPEYHALQTARINAGLPAEHPDDPKPLIEAPKKKHAI